MIIGYIDMSFGFCLLAMLFIGKASGRILTPVLENGRPFEGKLSLDPVEFGIIKEIYETMDGENWKWSNNYMRDGKPWNFTESPYNNPCQSHWQGLWCLNMVSDKGVGNLFYMGLTLYNLSGQLPANFFNFTKMTYMYLSENNIQGQLPYVTQLPELLLMNFSYNALSGTIPDCIGKATSLQLLYLSNNRLVGSIPDTFTNLLDLRYLYLLNNDLTGSLPSNIGAMKELLFLNLGVNRFRGTLPESLSELTKLEVLYLNNNTLSGGFPSCLPYSLTKLSLECNKLTGPVPQIFENYANLSILKLNDNYFTGPPPICLSTLKHLEILQLHLNQFTGPIAPLFDPQVQTKLTNIDLSHNAMSGELPAAIFQLPALKTFAAVKNCFSGTLPETICEASTINIISLDGLTSSTACVQYMWDPLHFLNTGYFAKSMRGRIPDCVWSLPNLTSLHLAGNSFTGKLFNPNTTTSTTTSTVNTVRLDLTNNKQEVVTYGSISPTLKNVSLSHNRLSGTIPSELLKFSFNSLDLSYNKLQGHVDALDSAMLKNSSDKEGGTEGMAINLKVNRLTGEVPIALKFAYDVNILEGNVFACSAYHDLPHHDPAYHYYVCGSDELNQSMIAFVCVGLILLVVTSASVLMYFYYHMPYSMLYMSVHNFVYRVINTTYYVRKYTTAVGIQLDGSVRVTHKHRPHIEKYSNYVRFLSSMNLMRSMFFYIALSICLVCMPIYLLYYLENYSSHEDRYAWITTTAFLSGQTPAVTLFAVWMVLCASVASVVLYIYNKKPALHKLHERYSSVSSNRVNRENVPTTPNTSVKETNSYDRGSTCSNTCANATSSTFNSSFSSDIDTTPTRTSLYPTNTFSSICNEATIGADPETSALLNAAETGTSPVPPTDRDSSSSAMSQYTNKTASVRNPKRCPVRFADEVIETTIPITNKVNTLNKDAPDTTTNNDTNNCNTNIQTEANAEGDDESSLLLSSHSSQSTNSTHSSTLFDASNSSAQKSANADDVNVSDRSSSPNVSLNNEQNSDSSISFSVRASTFLHKVNKKIPLLSILPMSLLFVMNALATITANIIYVYVMLSPIDSSAMIFVQITMAIFKLFWNLVVVRKLIAHVPYNKESIRAHSLMLIFNTLIAPCLASLVTDSQCIRDLIMGSNTTTTTYNYETCLEAYQSYDAGVYTTVCTHYADTVYTTDFNPPFVYNYSCGSAILTSYIPVYIYSYTMLALLLPFAFLVLASVPTAYIPKFVLSQIDGFLRPQDRNDNIDIIIDSRVSSGSNSSAAFVRFQHIFKARSVQALMVQHLALLLTFGITSPMLAFVIACAMFVDSYVLQTLMIRYVEFQTRSSVFYNTFNTSGSGSNTSGSTRDSLGSNNSGDIASDNANSAPDKADLNPHRAHSKNLEIEDTLSQRTSDTTSDLSQMNSHTIRQDSLVSRLYEEERLAELDGICGSTYRSVHHTIWLVYYCCVIFYCALLFDVVGDARGLESAISVPISGLIVGAFFRFTLSSMVMGVRKAIRRYNLSKEEYSMQAYKESRSTNENSVDGNGSSRGSEGEVEDSGLVDSLLLPSDESFAMHGLVAPPAAVSATNDMLI